MKRERVQIFFPNKTLTRQEFKSECDLGAIIKRFQRTPEGREILSRLPTNSGGQYLDVTDVPDFRAARDAVNRANASFMALPAVVRKRFSNDPAEFMDFCADPANLPELRKLGLAKPVKEADASVPAAG